MLQHSTHSKATEVASARFDDRLDRFIGTVETGRLSRGVNRHAGISSIAFLGREFRCTSATDRPHEPSHEAHP